MESDSFIFQKIAELLVDESINVRKQSESACLSCSNGERDLLIDQIIEVFKSNWQKKPIQCSFISGTLTEVNEKDPFNQTVSSHCFKFLLVDIFPNITNDEENPEESKKFTESCISFGQSLTKCISGLELFFSILFQDQSLNLLNNTYSLILLQKSINSIPYGLDLSNLIKKFFDSFIHSFSSTLSTNDNDDNSELTKIYENIAYSLNLIFDILSKSKFHITSQEQTSINSSLNEILNSFYEKLPNDNYDNNFRNSVFEFSITSTNFLDNGAFLSNTQSISEPLIKYLLIPEDPDTPVQKKSALILLALYHQIRESENDENEHILQSCSQKELSKVASSLLNFLSSNDQLFEIIQRNYLRAFLSVSSYIETLSPNSILDPSINSLKSLKDTFETKNVSSLLFLDKLVESGLISSSEQIKTICQLLSELCNKSKIIASTDATIYLFKLWTSLTQQKVIQKDVLKTSDIFRVISSPKITSSTVPSDFANKLIASITAENADQIDWNSDQIINSYHVVKSNDEVFSIHIFNKIILQISQSSQIPELLNVALDPKYAMASSVAFSFMEASTEKPDYSSELSLNKVLIPRALVYASCPFFSIKTRASIVKIIGKLNPYAEEISNEAQANILNKNCRSCCQRIVNQFILDCVDKEENPAGVPATWIHSVLAYLDLFQKTKHPDATKNDSSFSLSYIKAAVYTVLSILFTLVKNTIGGMNAGQQGGSSIPTLSDGRPLTLSSLFQPLFTKCNISDPVESVAMAAALVNLRNYNKQFVMDSFKAKSETRKFAQKDQGHIFILEFCSRMLDVESGYEAKVKDLLDDDSLPSDIRARCLKRVLKKGKTPFNSNKANLLINDALESIDEETIKLALQSFLLLIKKNQIQNYQDALVKIVTIYYSFPNLSELTKEILSLTPIELNFPNFCTEIFGANSIESANFITGLIETKNENKDPNDKSFPGALKNPNSATAVALMLLNPDYYNNGKKLAEIIFDFRNSAEEFPLTFYCSSEPSVSEEFVLKLFNSLKFYQPWNDLVIKAILLIAKDPRFDRVVPSSIDEFLKILGQVPKKSISNVCKVLGSLLFEKDKNNFVNKLLLSKLLTSQNQFILVSQLIEDIGPSIFAIAMKHKIEQPLYSNVLSIIQQIKMPDNIQLSAIIFIIFTISQILSISIDIGQSKDLKKNDILNLFNVCLKSMKSLTKYPTIESPRIQKLLNQAKESLANGTSSDFDDEEKHFNLIRSLFSVCPNEISIFHISFFTEISPIGAIAGYTEMIHQGRSLLNEILAIGQSAKKTALISIPNLKILSTDRYGDFQLGQLFDFVLDNLSVAPAEGFNCILQLFDWIPKTVLFEKSGKMFNNTSRVIRRIGSVPLQQHPAESSSTQGSRPSSGISYTLLSANQKTNPAQPPIAKQSPTNSAQSDSKNNSNRIYQFNVYDIINGLNCLTKYSDSLTFSSSSDFKSNIPYFLVYSYCYSSVDVTTETPESASIITQNISSAMKKGESCLVPAARKALLTLCQFSGMAQTAQIIQKNFTVDDQMEVDGEKITVKNRFLIEISKNFVQEMDLRCIDAAFTLLDEEQRNIDIKIAAAFLLCAAMNQKKGLERNIHLRLTPLLSLTESEKLKMGILRALKSFPIILD